MYLSATRMSDKKTVSLNSSQIVTMEAFTENGWPRTMIKATDGETYRIAWDINMLIKKLG